MINSLKWTYLLCIISVRLPVQSTHSHLSYHDQFLVDKVNESENVQKYERVNKMKVKKN